VIWIESTSSRLHTGSKSAFAKRRYMMSCTGSLPRKWSMRNRRSSGKIAVSPALSSLAVSRSVPNGFSTTSRAPSASPASASSSATERNIEGGVAT
jgi:hypothetical protein